MHCQPPQLSQVSEKVTHKYFEPFHNILFLFWSGTSNARTFDFRNPVTYEDLNEDDDDDENNDSVVSSPILPLNAAQPSM